MYYYTKIELKPVFVWFAAASFYIWLIEIVIGFRNGL